MKGKELDLPTSRSIRSLPSSSPSPELVHPKQQQPHQLTEQQVNKLIDAGAAAAQGFIEIGKGVVQLYQIRETGQQKVAEIDAMTRQIQQKLSLEIDKIRAHSDILLDRGKITRELLTLCLQAIPEHDHESRQVLFQQLPLIIEKTLNTKGYE